MKLIDIHAHLEHARFEKDLDKVIARFEKVGGEFVVNSGVNPETNKRALELSEKYDVVKVSFGLYPIDALAKEIEAGEAEGFLRGIEEFDVDEELKWIEENADKCVAIGECGLDYNWKDFQTPEMKEKQKEVFRKVLKLAKKIDKPVIVHSRKAEADAIEILEKEGWKGKKVVMHSFNGKKALIRKCVENGWFFSVPPVITRLHHFTTLVGIVPLGQLLTETDSPYLSPVVGKRNEPANVSVTIEEIAKIKKLSEKEVGEQIFNNTAELFSLK
jgi:TatD DNase family protein